MSGALGGEAGRPTPVVRRPVMRVRDLLAERELAANLTLLAGRAGLDRTITHARIQKSGLALVGHYHGIVPSRLQILGQTELSYLRSLGARERRAALEGFFALDLACVIVTSDLATRDADLLDERSVSLEGEAPEAEPGPPTELREVAEATRTPLLASDRRSSSTINALHALLDDRLAPRVQLHGVLVDVFGVGLLLLGKSGIGKSECALDLVMRGHRLVADDVVECDYRPPGMVFGAAPELLRDHIEVRGLGILNVKDLYGVTATRLRKRIDVVCRLADWTEEHAYDRLGLEQGSFQILGVPVRELALPVRPGRDMASIVEVAARNELLRNLGHHAAREFFDTIEGALMNERAYAESAQPPPVRETPSGGRR
jgi:HPr kinase/phosphorylase